MEGGRARGKGSGAAELAEGGTGSAPMAAACEVLETGWAASVDRAEENSAPMAAVAEREKEHPRGI